MLAFELGITVEAAAGLLAIISFYNRLQHLSTSLGLS